jgi:hypothetical protein
METIETPAIDKSTWGSGPWQSEPDRVDFVAHGFACLALRNDRLGQWCGYVGVGPDHPFHGRSHDEIDGEIEFHGGLSYAGACEGYICHVPAPGMPADVWWLGGDFAHVRDHAPGLAAREREIAREARRKGDTRAKSSVKDPRVTRERRPSYSRPRVHWHDTGRCEHCGAPDSRDAAHARGCPRLEPASREELLRLALRIEQAWADKSRGREAPARAKGGTV